MQASAAVPCAAAAPPRTLDAAPRAAVQLERLQEARVLLVRPALALLGDGVRLA
jgi:hypothetical protein